MTFNSNLRCVKLSYHNFDILFNISQLRSSFNAVDFTIEKNLDFGLAVCKFRGSKLLSLDFSSFLVNMFGANVADNSKKNYILIVDADKAAKPLFDAGLIEDASVFVIQLGVQAEFDDVPLHEFRQLPKSLSAIKGGMIAIRFFNNTRIQYLMDTFKMLSLFTGDFDENFTS